MNLLVCAPRSRQPSDIGAYSGLLTGAPRYLVLACALSLAACSDPGGDSDDSATTATTLSETGADVDSSDSATTLDSSSDSSDSQDGTSSASASDSESDTTTKGNDDDGTETGGPIPMGWLPVADAGGVAIADSVDLAISADGSIYVSWVQDSDVDEAYVARSGNGGMDWSSPSYVDMQGKQPRAGSGRQPYILATDDDVYMIYDVAEVAAGIFLHRSDAGDALDFSDVTTVAAPGVLTDYAHMAMSAGGEIWAAWQEYEGDPGIGFIAYGRESSNFGSQQADDAVPGLPCECCRLDLRFSAAGDAQIAFRNNDEPIRNMWTLRAPNGSTTFDSQAEASHTDWNSFTCPMEGPSLAEDAGGRHYIAWADSSSGNWMAYVGTSDDQMGSWGDESLLAPTTNGIQGSPVIAVGDSGTVYVVIDLGGVQSFFVVSDDQGENWSEPVFLANEAGNILNPRIRSDKGVSGAVGVAEDGSVWFYRFE